MSASSLLRGESIPAWKPYEDNLRQSIENTQVKDTKDSMKREQYLNQTIVKNIDCMADSSLFDLKVLHNSAQRAKSAAQGRRPRSALACAASPCSPNRKRKGKKGEGGGLSPGESMGPSHEVRELCKTLNGDIIQHCNRMRLPVRAVESQKMKTVVTKIQNMRGTLTVPEAPPKEEKPDPGSDFGMELKALFGKKDHSKMISLVPSSMTDRVVLAQLAKFLLGTSGSMRPTLEAIDGDGNGKFQFQDLCVGLELLGWAGDPEAAWRQLDFQGRGELTIGCIEERLAPHSPAAPEQVE